MLFVFKSSFQNYVTGWWCMPQQQWKAKFNSEWSLLGTQILCLNLKGDIPSVVKCTVVCSDLAAVRVVFQWTK